MALAMLRKCSSGPWMNICSLQRQLWKNRFTIIVSKFSIGLGYAKQNLTYTNIFGVRCQNIVSQMVLVRFIFSMLAIIVVLSRFRLPIHLALMILAAMFVSFVSLQTYFAHLRKITKSKNLYFDSQIIACYIF